MEARNITNNMSVREFEKVFEQEKAALLSRHQPVASPEMGQGEATADEVEFSSAMSDRVMELRLRNRDALYLHKLDSAIERLRYGSFGLCEGCGEEIEARRLEARPTTTHCLGCKEVEETREIQTIQGRRPKSWSGG